VRNRVRITTLVENTAGSPSLLGEHGLALWIECGERRVLFDTGQGGVLAGNARKLGVALERADAIVLSHGHYDHTGGLAEVLDGTSRSIGLPVLGEDDVRSRARELVWTARPTEICDGLFVTGQIPRITGFEDVGGPFFIDRQCRIADSLPDDQALFFASAQGTVVLLGCAHAGVINTLRYVRSLTDCQPVAAVLGGMHLGSASPERLERTVEALRGLDVGRLGPAHCTGPAAAAKLCSAFPGRCAPCTAGTTMEFESA